MLACSALATLAWEMRDTRDVHENGKNSDIWTAGYSDVRISRISDFLPKTMLTEINLNLGVEIPPVETVELSYILLKFSIYRVEIESLGRTVADTLL